MTSDPLFNPGHAPRRCRHPRWSRQAIPDLGGWRCIDCGHIVTAERMLRGRRARKRGNGIQRERITRLGGRNLAGNNPNWDGEGEMFSYESKSGRAFSEAVWRWLSGIPKRGQQTGVLIVSDAPGPGRRRRSYVVVEYDEWEMLHGEIKGEDSDADQTDPE